MLLWGPVEAQRARNFVLHDTTSQAPHNWFNLDPETDRIPGVSTERAYRELLSGKTPTEVIVAVIDSGIDVEHEDLQGRIWVNPGEIAGNGLDDDGNGYVDDVHGWNFIGGPNGEHVDFDTYEVTRLYKVLHAKYEGKTVAQADNKHEFALYQKVKEEFEAEREQWESQAVAFRPFYEQYAAARSQLQAALGKEEITLQDLEQFDPQTDELKLARGIVGFAYTNDLDDAQIEEFHSYITRFLDYNLNPNFDPRHIVGDDYSNKQERFYGNGLVEGPDAEHGTHVAGIIAARRDNALGMAGIAAPVKIMVLRAVPNGDERDKDIANAIRYAVDNGARIINMSFGKAYSPDKALVDEAVRYAAAKGVLLVHAAGNDSKNIDQGDNFPTKRFLGSKKSAENWLEVGASAWGSGTTFVGDFSNYGRKTVDVFAPGVDLYSTVPGSEYRSMSGTSMAAPVVSGVAALLMAYYPELSASQVKDILKQSAVRYTKGRVNLPGEEPESKRGQTRFKKLSNTGGVVNAYYALQLAQKQSKRQ
ncbi:S8 family peptidase [Cesiribacter andamanensis]|uniref:Cell wall-associated protease n=1 Tax=Cesiribacter andamanensis AMV16 TaxID=1279009 RepID=M7NYY6_9BACT|nr:S8 family peptidase [Cesiribacter andamanensis]EMR03584.1 Cell wall-associated protease precursor [Cesiribacter andamanensis AMV16]